MKHLLKFFCRNNNTNLDQVYTVFETLTELLDQTRYSLEWTQFGSNQVSVITSLVSNKQVLFKNMILYLIAAVTA